MPRLADQHKTFITQRLAMYDTPTQVADAVKEEFGLEIHRAHVAQYDPTREVRLAKKWRALFEATREKFLKDSASIPIAQKSVRLRRLERMSRAAENMKNYPLAAQLHEQAAKEVGDYYTNRRKLDLGDADGNAFPAGVTVLIGGSPVASISPPASADAPAP